MTDTAAAPATAPTTVPSTGADAAIDTSAAAAEPTAIDRATELVQGIVKETTDQVAASGKSRRELLKEELRRHEGEDSETPGKPAAPAVPAAEKKDETKGAEAPKDATRYKVIKRDATGKETDATATPWEEGRVVRFRADGKNVEVKSETELVRYAQQGYAAQRQLSLRSDELAQTRKENETLSTANLRDREVAESIMHAVLYGGMVTDADGTKRHATADQVRERLLASEAFTKALDPRAREAAKTAAAENAATAAPAKTEAAARAEWGKFWTDVDAEIEDALPAHTMLGKEDKQAVKEILHGGFMQLKKQLGDAYRANAIKPEYMARLRELDPNITVDQALALADQTAEIDATAAVRNPTGLPDAVTAILTALHGTRAERAKALANANAPAPAASSPSAPVKDPVTGKFVPFDASAADREIAAHNGRVEKKIEQRDANRGTLRGPGAATAGIRSAEPTPEQTRELPWKERKKTLLDFSNE